MSNLVSIFKNKSSKTPIGTMPLMRVLTSKKPEIAITRIRSLPLDDPRRQELKDELPTFAPSGTFSARGSQNIVQHNRCVALDFDHVDDPEAVKCKLIKYPFIFYAGLSCSGTGVVAYANIAIPELHSQYYKAMGLFFAKEGLILDPKCGDVGRIRFASFDPKPKIDYNHRDAWSEIPPLVEPKYSAPHYQNTNEDEALFLMGLDWILFNKVDVTAGRNYWMAIGSFIKQTFGVGGESLFQAVSQFHLRYSEKETAKLFGDCVGRGYSVGVFCNACSKVGVPQLKGLLIEDLKRNGGRKDE